MRWCNVEPRLVRDLWPQVQGHIRRGMKRGYGETFTEEGTLKALEDGRMQMLGLQDDDAKMIGSIILGLETRDKGPVLMVLMVAGKWIDEEAAKAQEIIVDHAQSLGAYKIETISRLGNEKRLKDMGWKSKAVVMEWRL